MSKIEKIREFYAFLQNINLFVSDENLTEMYEIHKLLIIEKLQEIDNFIENKNNN